MFGDSAGKDAAALIVEEVKTHVLPEIATLRLELSSCRELLEKLLNKRAVATLEFQDK